MLPNRVIVGAYTKRGAALWCITRAILGLVISVAQRDPTTIARENLAPMPAAVFLAVIVCFVDVRLRHERALLENLAVTRAMLAGMVVAPMLVAEIALGVVGLTLR